MRVKSMCKECKRIQSCISLIMGLALGVCTLPILASLSFAFILFASSLYTAVYSTIIISPFISIILFLYQSLSFISCIILANYSFLSYILLTQEIEKQKEILEAKKSKCKKMIRTALALKKEISSELKELQKEIDAEKNNAVKLQNIYNRRSFLSNIFYSNSIILILMYGCWHLQSIFSFQNIPCPLFFTPWPLLVSSSLALPIILFVTLWNREVTREIKVSSSNIFLSTSIFGYSFSSLKFYSSKNSLFYPLLSNLSLLFYHFAFTFYFIIFSEAILFLSIFWGHFHIIFSPIRFYLSWVILPSTCELTSTGSFFIITCLGLWRLWIHYKGQVPIFSTLHIIYYFG